MTGRLEASGRWLGELAFFSCFAVAAVAFTWPLAIAAHDHTPDLGFDDPLLYARLLRLHYDWLFGNRIGLFDADFFFPHPLTLITTDPVFGLVFVTLPFRLFTEDYLLLGNVALLASFALTGHATSLLVRDLTGDRGAGLFAGIAFAFCNYRLHQLDHLNILQMQWFVYSLVFLHRLHRSPKISHAAGVTIFLVLHGVSSANLALYSVLVFPAFAVWSVLTAEVQSRARFAFLLVCSACVAMALLTPLYLPFLAGAEAYEFRRPPAEIRSYSGRIEQLWATPPYNKLYGATLGKNLGLESLTFIGVAVLVLAILGFWLPRRSRGQGELAARVFYLLLGVSYLLLALGPTVMWRDSVIGAGPWLWLDRLPGFSTVRTPSRLFFVTSLAAAVLAGIGLARLIGLLHDSARKKRLTAVAVLAALAESWVAPLPLRRMTTLEEAPPVYEWLAQQPGTGAVLELPFLELGERSRMYFANVHRRPTVGGASGFWLPSIEWMRPAAFFLGRATPHLEGYVLAGLEYAVVHRAEIADPVYPLYVRPLEAAGATPVATLGSDVVFRFPKPAQPGNFTVENVRADVEVAPAAVGGAPLNVIVHFVSRFDRGVFEPRQKTLWLDVRTADGSYEGRHKILLSPPLLVPGNMQSAEVSVPFTTGEGETDAIFELRDDGGATWASSVVKITVASEEQWSATRRALHPSACTLEVVSAKAMPSGEIRAVLRGQAKDATPWAGPELPRLRVGDETTRAHAVAPGSPFVFQVKAPKNSLIEVRGAGGRLCSASLIQSRPARRRVARP